MDQEIHFGEIGISLAKQKSEEELHEASKKRAKAIEDEEKLEAQSKPKKARFAKAEKKEANIENKQESNSQKAELQKQ